MNATPRSNDSHDTTGGLSAGELLSAIWRTRRFVLAAVLLVGLGLAAVIGLARASMPSVYTFQHAIRFVFPQVQESKYPNGLEFSINDLVSPVVLQQVYTMNGLEKHGIKLDDFVAAISVTPYSATYGEVVTRFRQRLANRKLTFTERTDIETEMTDKLNQLSSGNALIRLVLEAHLGIAGTLGDKVVSDIARVWSDVSIKNRGVLNLPESIENRPLIEPKLISTLDFPERIDLLTKSVTRIDSRILALLDLGGTSTIIDQQSGHTPLSLRRVVSNFLSYRLQNLTIGIGPLKRSTQSEPFLKQRIGMLSLRKLKVDADAKAIRESLSIYSAVGKTMGAGSTATSTQTGGIGGGTSPQINADFIDRIIALAAQGSNEEFRRKLVERQLTFNMESAAITLEINVLKQRLAQVQKPVIKPVKSAAMLADVTAKGKRVSAKFLEATTKLNDYWFILNRLHDQLSEKRFSYGSKLYTNLLVDNKMISYHPVFNLQVILVYLASLFATAIIAMLLALLGQALFLSGRTQASD